MFFTPERLLILAVVISLMTVDGVRRMLRQRQEGELGKRPFQILVTALGVGTALAWAGFLVVWLGS